MKKGFNLIELLISISIIGILTATIIVGLNDARKKGRDATRKADINSVASALANYYADKHTYADTFTDLTTNGYLTSIPADPSGTSYPQYQYSKISDSEYSLLACLEKSGGSTGTGISGTCNAGPYYRLVNGEPKAL